MTHTALSACLHLFPAVYDFISSWFFILSNFFLSISREGTRAPEPAEPDLHGGKCHRRDLVWAGGRYCPFLNKPCSHWFCIAGKYCVSHKGAVHCIVLTVVIKGRRKKPHKFKCWTAILYALAKYDLLKRWWKAVQPEYFAQNRCSINLVAH